MCMLFGISSREPIPANDYLRLFFRRSSEHPHGWGLAVLDRTEALIEKESLQASRSHYLKDRLSEPIRAGLLLAHIRYATIGHVERRNCHPFTAVDAQGKRWTLIHNGTIFDYPPLSGYVRKQRGETDTERILLYLIDLLNDASRRKGRRLSPDEQFALLDSVVCDMAKGNKLNFLLSDGSCLYVHTNFRDTLFCRQTDGAALFATAPLTREEWQPVPFTTLLAYRGGRRIRSGRNHGCEYTEDPEQIKLLYQIYANL